MGKTINEFKKVVMPAEWENHSATQLHWPSNKETWPGRRMDRVEEVYLNIIDILHRYEPVILLHDPSIKRDYLDQMLNRRNINKKNVHLYSVPINDVWARDCGPIFVRAEGSGKTTQGQFVITDWEYNAWGEKYPPFDSDNKLPGWFADTFGIDRIQTDMVLEGGSIETNGNGVLLTTESVLLNENRNPGLNRSEIEQNLKHFLGVEKVIWLKDGLAGDDTDGHIDDLSRFLNRNTILTMITGIEQDINYKALQENYEILKMSTDQNGEPFHIITLPLPHTRIEGTTVDGSEYVPASYANFYIANGVVLVPLYDKNYDDEVLALLGEYFPDHDIAGIECADLVWGQGSIHCITQQLYGLDLKTD
jgi:agmatine deiminase